MASVNQRIPNFLGGVSQQPDKIKFPGQLRVCDNAVPDITFGLKKRPPAEHIKVLANATATGDWYEIIRDGDEKFLVQITEANVGSNPAVKPIRVWDLATGNEQTLTNAANDDLFDYLDGATKPYAVSTIQDYTLIANPQKQVSASTATTAAPINNGNYSFARLDTIAYNTEYILYNPLYFDRSTTAKTLTPNTYYRVTSVRVDRVDGSNLVGPTWDDGNKDQRFSGTLTWSFSGGDAIQGSSNRTNCENIEGTLVINGTSYIESNQQNFDSEGNEAKDFLGFTQVYETRYTATVTLTDGGLIKETDINTARGKFIDVQIEGKNYRIHVEAVEPVSTYTGVTGIAYYQTPKNPDNGAISMATILGELTTKVDSDLFDSNGNTGNFSSEIIGSGLFIQGVEAGGINFLGGAVNENMSVIGQRAQDISRLPAMCKHGYVAQISNTGDLETDDYYVIFEADNEVSGSGSWEETVRPHNFAGTAANQTMKLGLDPDTMPHALINNRNGTFTFAKLDQATATAQGNQNYWKNRTVGDDTSNPFPTFVDFEIQQIFFHRNRLGIISDENIILSQPGRFFDFFITSAIAASDDNPIDITVSDKKPAFINHVLPLQKGVMMFSDNAQFLLFTESDIFSPKTARLKKLASYECDSTIEPVDLGTSVLFTSNVSAYARAFEATIIDDDTPPQIIEQTRVVPEFLPKDITKATNSAAIGIVSYGKKGDTTVYHYKYYNAGTQREQSAWYSWTITGTLQHMLYTSGSFFTVTYHNGGYNLCKHEYVADASSDRTYVLGGTAADVGSPLKTARWFEAHLDNMAIATNVAGSAQTTSATEKTVLTIPYSPSNATNLFMVGLSGNDSDGNSIAGIVRAADSVSSNTVTFNNINIASTAKVAVGYKYTSTIELPTYYLNVGQNTYDLDAELRISGINFEMGVSGPMEFHVNPTYADMDSYKHEESGMFTNSSNFNEPPATLSKSIRVPIQKKNDKFTLQIKMPDPFSTALISASWDGNYNQKRHVRR